MNQYAVGGRDRCAVCGTGFNPFDPSTKPPTCSKDCWRLWTIWSDHKGNPCWITGCLEISCGVSTPGYCNGCEVFKLEQEIKKRGLNKRDIMGNY